MAQNWQNEKMEIAGWNREDELAVIRALADEESAAEYELMQD